MICPFCGHNDDKVIDSRSSDAGRVIRRRRECLKCSKRFTTYERVEQAARLMVVKKDGSRVPFSAENLLRSIQAACGKRPIPEEVKQRVVDEIDDELHREFEREVPSRVIGERVMNRLRDVDQVAYIRFASEYHQFKDLGELMEEAKALEQAPRNSPNQQRLFGQ